MHQDTMGDDTLSPTGSVASARSHDGSLQQADRGGDVGSDSKFETADDIDFIADIEALERERNRLQQENEALQRQKVGPCCLLLRRRVCCFEWARYSLCVEVVCWSGYGVGLL